MRCREHPHICLDRGPTGYEACPLCRQSERTVDAAQEQAWWAEAAVSQARQSADALEQRLRSLLRVAEAVEDRIRADGVCDCCGQRFVERTRKRPQRGVVWTGLLQDYTECGTCPRCYNSHARVHKLERSWTEEERLAVELAAAEKRRAVQSLEEDRSVPLGRKTCRFCHAVSFERVGTCISCGASRWWA